MKTRFLISLLVFSLLFSVIHIAYGVSANEYTVGKIEWPYKCHPVIFNTATIRVIDPDMNLDVKLQDTLDIQIWSNFDLREEYSGKILTLTLQETGNSTGIFDGIVFWGNPWDDSLGHRIPIWDGNTVTARYTDHTIPSNFSESKLEITNSIAIKDIKPVMKTKNGTTTALVIYEPCTLEIFEQKNVSLAEKTEFVFPPPLKQINSGIPYDEIKCKDSLVLLQKYDGTPACVKPDTATELQTRWYKSDTTEPKFEIVGIDYQVHPDIPLIVSVGKIGYDMCDSWDAKIIDVSDNSTVWERDYHTGCVVLDPPTPQKFEYKISNENNPIIVSEIGDYVFQITIGNTHLEKEFIVRNNFSGGSLDRTYSNVPNYDSNVLNCNDINPYKEYECFRDAFSNCQLAKVNLDIYTIEGSPIHTNATITNDCKIYGIIDTTTDVHGDRGIIKTTCETLSDDQYGWSIKDCDALNYPEMQFNFEMQLYPEILECEKNGNTWIREKLECVVG